MSDPTLLCWLDLETTGLDPRQSSILEVAVALARFRSPFVLSPMHSWVIRTFPEEWQNVDARVLDMHEKNGLRAACEASELRIGDVEEEILVLFADCQTEFPATDRGAGKPRLAGFSCHLDRSFLEVYMPRVYASVSHQLYDVSAVKLFCRSLGMGEIPKVGEGSSHRAAEDVRTSAIHAQVCARWLGHRALFPASLPPPLTPTE